MSAEPVRYEDADGSVFAAEIVPPDTAREPYHVDLLRASVDDYGLAREQRLTVGEYSSWGEAEEHLYEIEDGLAEDGWPPWVMTPSACANNPTRMMSSIWPELIRPMRCRRRQCRCAYAGSRQERDRQRGAGCR